MSQGITIKGKTNADRNVPVLVDDQGRVIIAGSGGVLVIAGTFNPRGEYDNSTDYAIGDAVSYDGSSYIMYADAPAGTLPTDTDYWQLIAEKGDQGDQGDQGDPGVPGTPGTPGNDGVGVPSGGSTGQVLAKNSGTNYDTGWVNQTGGVTSVNTQTGTVVLDQDDIGDGTTYKQYSQTEKTKLSGIEASADVTDATNVAAAGAVMEADTSTASMSFVVDEDDMASNSATKVPTQQSVKAYADKKGVLAYQVFTSSGTWTKPTGAKVVEVFCIGGGGGGGKGTSGAEGTLRHGGGGGGAGGAVIGQFDATGLTSTVSVTVGTGGAGATTDGAFAAGGNGGNSSFGSYVQAGGGNGGSCGSGFLGAGGGAAGASSLVAAGGASGNFSGVGFQPPGSNGHMGSGAGGAARNAANTTSPALAGGNSSAGAGGTGGGAASVGGNGANGSGTNGGAGGGGGGIGQVGGNGGTNGGGGGGGGAAIAPAASGNGGNGGNGIVIVITYG